METREYVHVKIIRCVCELCLFCGTHKYGFLFLKIRINFDSASDGKDKKEKIHVLVYF